MNGQCLCSAGFTGVDCSVAVPMLPAPKPAQEVIAPANLRLSGKPPASVPKPDPQMVGASRAGQAAAGPKANPTSAAPTHSRAMDMLGSVVQRLRSVEGEILALKSRGASLIGLGGSAPALSKPTPAPTRAANTLPSSTGRESSCKPACAASGRCVNGRCLCAAGFTGLDCALAVPTFNAGQSTPPTGHAKHLGTSTGHASQEAVSGHGAKGGTSLLGAVQPKDTSVHAGQLAVPHPLGSASGAMPVAALKPGEFAHEIGIVLSQDQAQSLPHDAIARGPTPNISHSHVLSSAKSADVGAGHGIEAAQHGGAHLVGEHGAMPPLVHDVVPRVSHKAMHQKVAFVAESSQAHTSQPGAPAPAPAVQPQCDPVDCSGHGNCTITATGSASCVCEKEWKGMACDMQGCVMDCNSQGLCIEGECICNEEWYGEACQHIRCPHDCSAHGYCFSGQCQCKAGYSGEGCQQVTPSGLQFDIKTHASPPKLSSPAINRATQVASLRSFSGKPCPDHCNHRGTCSVTGECHCYPGYSGLSCESLCPNECSHQGDCIEGACLCFAGFLGIDCSIVGCCSGHGSCDDPGVCVCDKGWAGLDCSRMLMCPDPACSGHGDCIEGKCHCFQGFEGPICASAGGGCNPPCGPNGFCNPASKKCDCEVGWTGIACLTEIKKCPENCNGRGLCFNGRCMCGPGWDGKSCGTVFLAPGQMMTPEEKKKAGGDAGKEEKKKSAGGGGGPSMITGIVTEAPAAEKEAEGATPICGENGLCGGHGVCDTEKGECKCDHMWSWDEKGDCLIQHCPGWTNVSATNQGDCYSHGLCESGTCRCADGWGLLETAPAEEENVCRDEVCSLDCGKNGVCKDGTCICNQGWKGKNCREPQCSADCSGHGSCTFINANGPGQCTCDYGWGGAACHRKALYETLKTCENDCSANGLCMDGRCMCNVGWKGISCQEVVCGFFNTQSPECALKSCPNNCQGQGLCMAGTCACWEGFMGPDCAIPTQCYEPCGKICSVDGASEKCQQCLGQCNTLLSKPWLGAHDPYQDLQSTLLQRPARAMLPNKRAMLPNKRLMSRSPHHQVSSLQLGTSPRVPAHRRHHEVSAVHLSGVEML